MQFDFGRACASAVATVGAAYGTENNKTAESLVYFRFSPIERGTLARLIPNVI